MLRQSYLSGDLLDGRLVLGGDLADLGTGIDVLYEDASTDELRFELIDDRIKQPWECEFKYSRTADSLLLYRFGIGGPVYLLVGNGRKSLRLETKPFI